MSKQWVYYTRDSLPQGIEDPKLILGGKGASLQAMSAAGLPVPPAFVISTEACEYFFEHHETWPEGLEEQIRENLERLESDMQRNYGSGEQPLLVSVRSGAARSMPGMMDTLLNVGLHPALAEKVGDTPDFWDLYAQFIMMYAKTVADFSLDDFDDLKPQTMQREQVEAMIERFESRAGEAFPRDPWHLLVACINHVFRSWNNERAIQYRKRHDIHGLRGTAVNVQAMFPSHVSGIVFTRDPTDLSEHLVIEASYGLGEAVVSGDVAPDKFIVQRHNFNDVHSTLGDKSHYVNALGDDGDFDPDVLCLNQEQLHELCDLSLRIEKHYGKPMDIEFGLADGRFALLQCRQIRGLDVLADIENGRREEIERLKKIAHDREKVWVAHNLGETLTAPTPLTWDIVRHFMSGDGGFGRMYRDFGYMPSRQVRKEGFLELICGRIYADPDRLSQLFWAGMPMRYDLEEVVRDPKIMDSAPTRFEADDVEPEFLVQAPKIIWSMVKTSRRMAQTRRIGHRIFEEEVLPDYLKYVEAKRSEDLSTLDTEELIGELHARRRR
ncbi:MAG: PEP/pyruvate-binding domain-containing protein, partial [Candidatus Sumerlaeota bacterium]